MRRILCAVDHSEPSVRAAMLALELSRACHADLRLVNVVPSPEGTQQGIVEFLQHEHNREPPGIVILEAARAELASFSNRLASESGVAITCEVRTGTPAAQIVASAKVHAIDLMVIGHRGHNRLAQILLGSVARGVLDTASCPVLIVR